MAGLRDRLLTEGTEWKDYIMKPIEAKDSSKYMAKKTFIKVENDVFESGKLEAQVKKECKKYLESIGYKVRAVAIGAIQVANCNAASNPLKGFPDLIAINKTKGFLVFVEIKRNEGGKLSPEQVEWIFDLTSCRQTVFVVTSKQLLQTMMQEAGLN